MKKLTAIILVIMMFMTMLPAMSVAALKDNENLGTVPKTLTVPAMDGVKDAIYDKGMKISVRIPAPDQENNKGGGGDLWLLWDDSYLYVFGSFNLENANDLYAGSDEDHYRENWWEYTMIEFCVDFANEGGDNNIKYMPSARGLFAAVRGWPPEEADGVAKVIDGVPSKIEGNVWNTEFRIGWKAASDLLDEKGQGFGSPAAAGKEIGFFSWFQERSSDETAANFNNADTTGDIRQVNTPDTYDYIVLGANEVKDEPEAPAEAEQPAANGGETAETPAPAATPAPVTAPVTGDAVLPMFILMAVLSLTIVGLKLKKIKN